MKVTDRMIGDILGIGLNGNGELPLEQPEGKLLKMPIRYNLVSVSSNYAIQNHIKNLFITYGQESVVYHMTELLKESK